ncbi:unnamed protein product, partial [Prorocentrum cordatum]
LTADALTAYAEVPGGEDPSGGGAAPRPTAELPLVRVAAVLGTAEGSRAVKLVCQGGAWWELRGEPAEVAPWASEVHARFRQFRFAAQSMRTSVAMDEQLSKALARSRRRRLKSSVRRTLPCCACILRDPPRGSHDFSTAVNARQSIFRGPRTKFDGGMADPKLLEGITDPDLQEVQVLHWSSQAVQFLRRCERIPKELSEDFAQSMRKGVPDGLKRLIWPLAAGTTVECSRGRVDLREAYSGNLERTFGSLVPAALEDPVPTFCQGIQGLEGTPVLRDAVPYLWLLSPEGEQALRRLLWCTQLTTSSVRLCPFLPCLLAALLAFFSEEEAMHIVETVIDAAEGEADPERSSNPRIVLTVEVLNKQAKLFVREGRRAGNAPEALGHLEGLGVDLHAAAAQLLQDVDSLAKAAFSIQLRDMGMAKVSSAEGSLFVRAAEGELRIFCRPRLHAPRGNCPDELWAYLWPFVPARYRILDPQLVYLPSMHGTSLRTCLELCKAHIDHPMVFFLYTPRGDIIGGFSPLIWRKTNGYLALREVVCAVDDAFAFQLPAGSKAPRIFHWTGSNELLLQASETSGLHFGGDGPAVFVRPCLTRAQTSASRSFDSPPLTAPADDAVASEVDGPCAEDDRPSGEYVDFELARLEIFALA